MTGVESMERLRGRVALITGASSGIGAAVAEAYAREGSGVVVNYSRNREGAEKTVSCIIAAGGKAIAVKADVSDEQEVKEMINEAHKAFGPVDILVNNAALLPAGSWETNDEKQWDRMMEVNLKGHYHCMRAVSEDMKKAGYGKIINVSSVVYIQGYEAVDYTSTKAAIVGFTKSMAVVLGPYNICVNAILPGLVRKAPDEELDDLDKQTEEHRKIIEQQIIKKVGRPAYVTGSFVFLASHESDFITGSCLAVDGGYTRY